MQAKFQVGDTIKHSYMDLKGTVLQIVLIETGHTRHQEIGYYVKDGRRKFVIAESDAKKN